MIATIIVIRGSLDWVTEDWHAITRRALDAERRVGGLFRLMALRWVFGRESRVRRRSLAAPTVHELK
jgi:hypothetical protein